MNSLEDEADKIYRRLVADLLAPEDGVPTPDVLTVLKLKEVVQILEDAAQLISVLDLKLADHSRHQEIIRSAQWSLLQRTII